MSDYYRKWYQENKEKLAARRKAKYESDPQYRDAAISRARTYREGREKKAPEKPHGYEFTLQDVADRLEITPFTLRSWLKKGYYPKPDIVNGKYWLTQNQYEQLLELWNFLRQRGFHPQDADQLEALTQAIHLNWS